MSELAPVGEERLLRDLRAVIENARVRAAQSVNSELILLYWDLGHGIRTDVLHEQRAEYGEQILPTLSAKLTAEYGQGYSARNLARMIQFAETFPDRAVVATLAERLAWSHFVEILPLREPLEREFYATMCHACQWSVRGLRREIESPGPPSPVTPRNWCGRS